MYTNFNVQLNIVSCLMFRIPTEKYNFFFSLFSRQVQSSPIEFVFIILHSSWFLFHLVLRAVCSWFLFFAILIMSMTTTHIIKGIYSYFYEMLQLFAMSNCTEYLPCEKDMESRSEWMIDKKWSIKNRERQREKKN